MELSEKKIWRFSLWEIDMSDQSQSSSSRETHFNSGNREHNRRQRFLRTADILKKSGLLEITTKTRDLIIKNNKLKEEISKVQVEVEDLFLEILNNPENRQYKELYESLQANGQVSIESITSADNTEILELQNS
ncbi:CLOCK-interacting pacemaker-like isoform X2 [Artemia franciscana]|uniref:CLOCK-interacting pacemaker-like isoform X2 n=1 Tax=Artemia franciscana TaxID=6661 RepID=UPI0032DA3718